MNRQLKNIWHGRKKLNYRKNDASLRFTKIYITHGGVLIETLVGFQEMPDSVESVGVVLQREGQGIVETNIVVPSKPAKQVNFKRHMC